MAEICGKSDVKAPGFGRPSLANLNLEVSKDERWAFTARQFLCSSRVFGLRNRWMQSHLIWIIDGCRLSFSSGIYGGFGA